MKVIFFTNIPSPYRVDFWNMLGCKVELIVVFERRYATNRNNEWLQKEAYSYHPIYCKGIEYGCDSTLSLDPVKIVRNNRNAFFLVGNASSYTGMITISTLKFFDLPYLIVGDGAFVHKSNPLKKLIKKYLYSDAVACLSTCTNHTLYYMDCGVNADSIYCYPFTSISEEDIFPVDENAKKRIKNEKKVITENNVIFVGQFIYRKGLDILLKVASKTPNINYYLSGGRDIPKNFWGMDLPVNVHILGFLNKETLASYLQAMDLFVLPTREDIWGLVVQEALAKGLPVITTNMCNAGLELIENDKNGYIVDVESEVQLKQAIIHFFAKSENEKASMRKAATESVKPYTMEKMVKRNIEILEEIERYYYTRR